MAEDDYYDDMDYIIVDTISDHPSIWDKNNYTEDDENIWDEITEITGVQKSWMKKRWQTIRDDYRKISIYNSTHTDQIQPHPLADRLAFIPVDISNADEMDFQDLEQISRGEIIQIDESVLIDFDPYPNITIESVLPSKNAKRKLPSTQQRENGDDNTGSRTKNIVLIEEAPPRTYAPKHRRSTEASTEKTEQVSNQSKDRDEDEIFGELVAAMLKKLSGDEKKRVKKEIMNILL